MTFSVLIGAFEYFGAAKDRGNQNFLEVLFGFPLVVFYTICCNELLEKEFKNILVKLGKCKKIQKEKGGNYNEIYKKLLKQKILICGVPLMFRIGVIGFFVAGVYRFFTQYRYNKEQREKKIIQFASDIPSGFKTFL